MDNVFNKNSISETSDKIAELMKKVSSEAKSVLMVEFNKFFDLVPEISIIEWNQYTPYFNDGDACTFSVNPLSFYIDNDDKETTEDSYEYNPFSKPCDYVYRNHNDEYYENIISKYDSMVENFGEHRINEINVLISQFEAFIAGIDDNIMLSVFGDGVVITATKDGFEVDEYDHE
jgi:Zn-finger protein